ncbi:hypothetical protein HDU89_005381 [Geranomyces variabilis]|nr:hypothetical protein HDU89_005381 [Geranomyces variabilis]
MLSTEDADHPALRRQFLSRADSALTQLDALLAELQSSLAALRSANKPLGPDTPAETAAAESRLRELLEKLKPDCAYLDQGAWILDVAPGSPSLIENTRAALASERDTLAKQAKVSTETLEACLQRCYQLQDLLADVGVSQEMRIDIGKTLPSLTPSGTQDINAMDES